MQATMCVLILGARVTKAAELSQSHFTPKYTTFESERPTTDPLRFANCAHWSNALQCLWNNRLQLPVFELSVWTISYW